jgi:hypothetical protein
LDFGRSGSDAVLAVAYVHRDLVNAVRVENHERGVCFQRFRAPFVGRMAELDAQAKGLQRAGLKKLAVPSLRQTKRVSLALPFRTLTHLHAMQWIVDMPLDATART